MFCKVGATQGSSVMNLTGKPFVCDYLIRMNVKLCLMHFHFKSKTGSVCFAVASTVNFLLLTTLKMADLPFKSKVYVHFNITGRKEVQQIKQVCKYSGYSLERHVTKHRHAWISVSIHHF